MEITVNFNDAYRELCKITCKSETELHSQIIKGLESIGFLQDWSQEAGKTIQELIEEFEEHTIDEVVESIFPTAQHIDNEEIRNFVGSILLWGDSSNNPCPQCGCECEVEFDGDSKSEWQNSKCLNSSCDYSDSTEPDRDLVFELKNGK